MMAKIAYEKRMRRLKAKRLISNLFLASSLIRAMS